MERGINFTNWFRFPVSRDDRFLANYISDQELDSLHQVGFTFVRLAVQPDVLAGRTGLLVDTIKRIQRHGFGVMVGWHKHDWKLESSPTDAKALLDLWQRTAPALRGLDPKLTFPEIVNEPVFSDPARWGALQQEALGRIRAALPDATVVLTGPDWSSIKGLKSLSPVADRNVVYTIHIYEPQVLTTVGAFEPSLDHRALARLPFPTSSPQDCARAQAAAADTRTREVAKWYCSEHWDAEKVRQAVRRAGEWARRNEVHLVAGEFGASNRLDRATRLAWITAMRTAMEREGIGWALWGYDDSLGFALRPHPGARLDPDLLAALGLHAQR
ncbi:Glycoside hydrolase family 5 protein [Rhodovastum atsumiense]|nr:cellulase family glycosylhydrolase [Rhodovastum atsumiense]CAH2604120.1 Glycoside hydrolase family 5 protein [Rhodovastum atsumiense]